MPITFTTTLPWLIITILAFAIIVVAIYGLGHSKGIETAEKKYREDSFLEN